MCNANSARARHVHRHLDRVRAEVRRFGRGIRQRMPASDPVEVRATPLSCLEQRGDIDASLLVNFLAIHLGEQIFSGVIVAEKNRPLEELLH